MRKEIELAEVDAQEGYDLIQEYAEEGEYLASMWLPQIEQRWANGERLEDLIAAAISTAYSWSARAHSSLYPKEEGTVALTDDLLVLAGLRRPEPDPRVIGHGATVESPRQEEE